jgi:hypothetical protein
MWKRLLGAMLVLDLAAAGLFVVYVERRDTASAAPSVEPSPCPTPVETVDPIFSPTPALTLQVSPAETPSTMSSALASFDPDVLEEGDHFGEGGPSPSPSPSPSGSARASASPSPSPSVAERAPTSPDRLAAQVVSAAPLSTPPLTSPTPLPTILVSPAPFECASPVPSLTSASISPSPITTVTTASPSPSASPLVHADTAYENATLGYTFSHPESWVVRANGSLTELLNPSRQALVSFGRGPDGSLSKASDAYFSSLRQRYTDFDPSFTQVETISGAVSRVMVGRATNEDGKRLRFQAILIHGEDENFAGASFAALDISSSVRAALDEIIGSFELPPS